MEAKSKYTELCEAVDHAFADTDFDASCIIDVVDDDLKYVAYVFRREKNTKYVWRCIVDDISSNIDCAIVSQMLLRAAIKSWDRLMTRDASS